MSIEVEDDFRESYDGLADQVQIVDLAIQTMLYDYSFGLVFERLSQH